MPRSGVPQNGRVIATTDPLPGGEPRAAFARLSREGGGSGERGPRYVRAPRAHNRSCPDMCPDPRCYLCISHHETSLTSAGHVSRSQMRPRNNQVVRVELTPPKLAPAFKFAESLQQANNATSPQPRPTVHACQRRAKHRPRTGSGQCAAEPCTSYSRLCLSTGCG